MHRYRRTTRVRWSGSRLLTGVDRVAICVSNASQIFAPLVLLRPLRHIKWHLLHPCRRLRRPCSGGVLFWFRFGGQERVVLPVDRPAGYIDSDTSLQHLVAIEGWNSSAVEHGDVADHLWRLRTHAAPLCGMKSMCNGRKQPGCQNLANRSVPQEADCQTCNVRPDNLHGKTHGVPDTGEGSC